MREILIRVPVYKFEELEPDAKWIARQMYIIKNKGSTIDSFGFQSLCDHLHLEFLADGSSDFTEVKLNKYQKEEE